MMTMKRFYPALLTALSMLLIFGCNSKDKQFQAALEKFMSSEIRIPELSAAIFNGQDTIVEMNHSPLAKMVILYDSTVCGSCKVSGISRLQIVTDFAKVMQNRFEPVFIFAPSATKEREVRVALKTRPFEWPVFIDTAQKFVSSNRGLPENKLLHTFLLDKNNKVVLVGDPVSNPNLWNLYKSTIIEMVNNNGVLRSE